MTDFNPVEIEKSLRGMNFPGNKQAIMAKARENGAKEAELGALEKLPEKDYKSPSEVTAALGDNKEE